MPTETLTPVIHSNRVSHLLPSRLSGSVLYHVPLNSMLRGEQVG